MLGGPNGISIFFCGSSSIVGWDLVKSFPDLPVSKRGFGGSQIADSTHFAPRIILRTDWQARDQVVLQWAHWFNGPLTTARTGYPPVEDLATLPDSDVISISANFWW